MYLIYLQSAICCPIKAPIALPIAVPAITPVAEPAAKPTSVASLQERNKFSEN